MSAALSREFSWFNETQVAADMSFRELEALREEVTTAPDFDSLPKWVQDKLKEAEIERANTRAGKRRWK